MVPNVRTMRGVAASSTCVRPCLFRLQSIRCQIDSLPPFRGDRLDLAARGMKKRV